MEQIYTCELSP